MCAFVACRGLLVLSIALACCWTATGLPTNPEVDPTSSSDDNKDVVNNQPCVYKGQALRNGERLELNVCSFCVCDNATVSCQFESCPPCPNSQKVPVEGQCCPFCDRTLAVITDLPCRFDNGRVADHGERVKMNDCSYCSCDNSTISCHLESCPPLHCSSSQRVKVEGECCKICDYSLAATDLPCRLNSGRIANHGERVKISDCSSCICDNSSMRCRFETCPPLSCGGSQSIKVDGQCCKVCYDNSFNELPCIHDGKITYHGERSQPTDCTACSCDNSTLTCQYMTCLPLECSEQIKVEGVCCKICNNTSVKTPVHDEDASGDDGVDEIAPPADSSLQSILDSILKLTESAQQIVDQERRNLDRDLANTRHIHKKIADMISIMENGA